jgi:outer membrane protein
MACAALGGAAHAENWIVTIGGRGTIAPPYEGADRVVLRGAPSINIRRPGTPFRYVPPDGGFRVGLLSNRWLSVGPMFRLQESRDHRGKLQGLQKVDWAVEAGGFVDVWPAEWLRGHVEVRKGISGHHGVLGEAGVDLVANRSDWNASIGPRIGLGDQTYMQQYFGVTPFQEANSPYIDTTYRPDGGTRFYGAAASLSHRMDEHWRVTGDVSYHRLAGDAKNSPIIDVAGSKDQIAGGLGVFYTFGGPG